MRKEDLQPPDRGAWWSALALTNAQLTRLCGLTTRQIIHWTTQGYIVPSRQRPVRYNGSAADLCMPIEQGLDQGLPLRRAVAVARQHPAAELPQQPHLVPVTPPTLTELHERLRGAEEAIEAVCRQMAPFVAAAPERNRREEAASA